MAEQQPSDEPPPRRPERTRRLVRIEVAVALIGLVGLLIGGAITAWVGTRGTRALQDRADRREDRREASEARGAARVLYEELLYAATQIDVLGHDRILRRFDPSYAVDVPPGDVKLIASRLDGDQWGQVLFALVAVQGLDTFVNTQVERGRHRLTKGEVCYLKHDVRSIRNAVDALRELAGAPGRSSPPAPLRCKPEPGPVPSGVP